MGPSQEINQGDDIAGTVHAVGPDVTEFHTGDRVAAFHEMTKPHGSYAEYALSWAYTTFHIPTKTTYEGSFPPLFQPCRRSELPYIAFASANTCPAPLTRAQRPPRSR